MPGPHDLFQRQNYIKIHTEKERENRNRIGEIFRLLVLSPNDCNSWGWARPKPGSRIFIWSLIWVQGLKHLGCLSRMSEKPPLFLRHISRKLISRPWASCHMGFQDCRWWWYITWWHITMLIPNVAGFMISGWSFLADIWKCEFRVQEMNVK